jgi:hypothetical protein
MVSSNVNLAACPTLLSVCRVVSGQSLQDIGLVVGSSIGQSLDLLDEGQDVATQLPRIEGLAELQDRLLLDLIQEAGSAEPLERCLWLVVAALEQWRLLVGLHPGFVHNPHDRLEEVVVEAHELVEEAAFHAE